MGPEISEDRIMEKVRGRALRRHKLTVWGGRGPAATGGQRPWERAWRAPESGSELRWVMRQQGQESADPRNWPLLPWWTPRAATAPLRPALPLPRLVFVPARGHVHVAHGGSVPES